MTAAVRDFLDRGSVQGAMMAGAMVVAGGFDAMVSIVAGRLLVKEQFAVFIAVVALIQVLVNVTNVIRTVVAYYTADFTANKGQGDAWVQRVLSSQLVLVVALGGFGHALHASHQPTHRPFHEH